MELQWPLIIFTTFVCIASGTFGVLNVVSGKEEYARTRMPALIVTFIAVVAGGVASIAHLQTPSRYFGQFGNLSSGINHEIIGLVLIVIMLVIYFVQLHRSGKIHMVVRVLSIIVCAIMIYVMADSYMMASKPAWNTVLLVIYYLLNAAALGAIIMTIIACIRKVTARECRLSTLVALIVTILFALAVIAYAIFLCTLSGADYTATLHVDSSTVPPVNPSEIGERMISGDVAGLFWGGVIAAQLVVPLVALIIAWRKESTRLALSIVAALFVIGGGIAFRALFYIAGGTIFVY